MQNMFIWQWSLISSLLPWMYNIGILIYIDLICSSRFNDLFCYDKTLNFSIIQSESNICIIMSKMLELFWNKCLKFRSRCYHEEWANINMQWCFVKDLNCASNTCVACGILITFSFQTFGLPNSNITSSQQLEAAVRMY